MVSISRNTVAYALINFAFWGFLGAQAYTTLNFGIQATIASGKVPMSYIPSILTANIIPGTIAHTFDTATILGMIPSLFQTLVFFLLGWGISMIFRNRNIMIAIAGFGAAALNLTMVVTNIAYNTTSIQFTILQDIAAILLYMGLAQWMLSNVEYKSNPYQSLALAGWGGILIVIVMGALFEANTMYAGLNSYQWAFVFSYCVLFMFGIGGLLLHKEKANVAQTLEAGPVKH